MASPSAATATAAAETPRQPRRIKTESDILDAFGALVERVGLEGLGVNALVEQAGVGKKQVYEYFGGLPGVAEAWAQRLNMGVRLQDMLGEDMARFQARSAFEKMGRLACAYASTLRANPGVCAVMAAEFAPRTELRQAVERVRLHLWSELEGLLGQDARKLPPHVNTLTMTLLPAATYLGLRARFEPIYFGRDLRDESVWREALARLNDLALSFEKGAS
jgi:AcrR family transcriptional regulator